MENRPTYPHFLQLDLNNRMTEDEALEKAYDIFLEQAVANLDPADSLLFSLQFEERGGAELSEPSKIWLEQVDFELDPDFFSEVIIGLAESDDAEIDDIFARVLICREKAHPTWWVLWKK
ncbi:HI1450 family dsDNA-mimic protein [Xenorhabdus budapestensis]|uniref:HI1450 family dsDNA-mimic protein n=1 Tax=Xenorhabdus budapestensis TaxID=290110 RepID=UPI001FD1E063|nr:HI1450 family dsDNA-mimic protein [Xenorhabdus budapestensis]